jgi:hypothetical protein
MYKLTNSNTSKIIMFEKPVLYYFCYPDKGRIFARNSASKIANLCRISDGDFSFLEMTNCALFSLLKLFFKAPYSFF